MSDPAMRVFSTAFKVDVVGRLVAGEALAAVSRGLGSNSVTVIANNRRQLSTAIEQGKAW
jgi:hypothetical protein